jgi:UDP-N-acetylglucosamine 2-epimerase (non-hydrolysing)/GDP/UDP-N,N'-diacetylbacillosamine 2-epimerase (hydrolysing)
MRKICVITGTRAEYGILSNLIKLIHDDKTLLLQIVATNMHLSPEFGLTYKEIESDGFHIDKKVEMLLSSDTSNGTVKSMGLGTIGFADVFEDLRPDIVLILGDRYEMLVAAQVALIYKIPIAHLYGGEITEGAYDDSIRHAITKLSHLHFTSTEEYRMRVIQLGEQPKSVFYVGSLGVENIKNTPLMTREELEDNLKFPLGDKSLLVTYHPVTLEYTSAGQQIRNLLDVLETLPEYRIIFTMPNSDTGGRVIIEQIEDFVGKYKERAVSFTSLGKKLYFSALQYISAVVGNSSSGIVEVPSFGIPTLNIGNRQKGRIAGGSVIHCGTTKAEIAGSFKLIYSDDIVKIAKLKQNPYDRKGSAEAIIHVLKEYPLESLIQKSFYNL